MSFALHALAPTTGRAQSSADSASILLGAADSFQRAGDEEVASALYEFILLKFPDTPVAELIRDRVGQATIGSGSIELRVWSTMYGLFLGVMIPVALDADGTEPYGVGILLGGPAGFFGGRALSGRRPYTMGQARAITWGGTWGAIQGGGWSFVARERVDDGATIAGSGVGLLAGLLLARRDVTEGVAETASLGSLWGMWFGTAAGALFDLDHVDRMAAALITGNVGLIAGAGLAHGVGLSRSQARAVSLVGVLGGAVGLGVTLIARPEADRSWLALPLAGSVAGLVGGAVFSRSDSEILPEATVRASLLFDRSNPRAAPPASGVLAAGSLIAWHENELSLGLPIPTPVRLESDPPPHLDDAGVSWRISLVNIRF